MTVAETLAELKAQKDIEPDASYTGTEETDDFILAIQTDESKQAQKPDWIVCADHVKEHSGSLNASTTDEAFIRTGNVTTKTGTQRTFAVNGNRCVGDTFQDFALSHKIKYGTGKDVIVPYIYFSIRTGKGEVGEAALIVTSDVGGAANASATFALDVKAVGIPKEFDYLTEGDTESSGLNAAKLGQVVLG